MNIIVFDLTHQFQLYQLLKCAIKIQMSQQGSLVISEQLQAFGCRDSNQPLGRRVSSEGGEKERRLPAFQARVDGANCQGVTHSYSGQVRLG